jgi:hypothetical protein
MAKSGVGSTSGTRNAAQRALTPRGGVLRGAAAQRAARRGLERARSGLGSAFFTKLGVVRVPRCTRAMYVEMHVVSNTPPANVRRMPSHLDAVD